MAEAAKWYVVHTYSGYENTVKATIEKTIESRQLQDRILAISIPMETVTEITESGVSKTYDRKVFPGYVLVKMVYSDDTWHVIRNIRGVTGFVGTSSNDPTPLTEDEVYAMGIEKKEIIVNYEVGDTVRILDGPLSSFTGVVESIEVESNTVNVIVSMFGRETSVEFELDQIEVASQ
ncbi:MAG: transcription termination/antitermination factor NusG [Oscillospiraceae bacterium]|nr:transcription termination/antitermination factor NusG [Oscillospiraceae bacterium]MBQ9930089.1 transcription termination/antitermination factor NusG [Oscillospiraceae bacterium]